MVLVPAGALWSLLYDAGPACVGVERRKAKAAFEGVRTSRFLEIERAVGVIGVLESVFVEEHALVIDIYELVGNYTQSLSSSCNAV